MAEAMRHRSVFSPRSSNRTCGFTASGSPTGFTSRHTVDCQFGLVSRDDTVARNQLSPCGRAPSEASGYFQVLQAHRQSPILGSFESVPEVRVLSSAGITRPHRSYDPVRLPPGPPCSPRRWRCDLRPERASPDYPDHLSNVPCPIPRWIGTGAYVGCFPIPRGLPRFPGGSASTISLSRPAQTSLALRPAGSLNRPRRPLSRGFETAGYPTAPLVSYQINRQLSGWYLPPLVIRAFGAHVESRKGAVVCTALASLRFPSPLISRVGTWRADFRVRWLFHCFRSGPQSGSHDHVSNSRLVKRSVRFSRTALSYCLHPTGYVAY